MRMMIQIRSVSPSPEGLFNEGKAPGSEMLNHSQFSQLTVACLAEHLLKKSCMMNPPVRRGDWCIRCYL
ncbi:hypothetical protein EFV10_24775 [Escherichia coli]|nr:hypothetical protein [Escherichia coli]OTC56202.1 hypothetical protein AW081_22125 [Escherichia coli]RNI76191.1 hypothetical protein EFV10_24775 [Escherichia coli]RNI99436.1 hypothetical protein EFV07_17905 [Escherichia coli]RNJ28842.1 hypothetical protein EFV02_24805 [Escherichia coli]